MEKMGKKLTDRELIDQVLTWYKLDQSTEELREAVRAYVQQNAGVGATTIAASSHEQPHILEEQVPSVESLDANRNGSKHKHADSRFESTRAVYEQQFEPTDELIGVRGWRVDAWALYYGIEEFFHRVSFGLLTMQSLAVLFCILVSGLL